VPRGASEAGSAEPDGGKGAPANDAGFQLPSCPASPPSCANSSSLASTVCEDPNGQICLCSFSAGNLRWVCFDQRTAFDAGGSGFEAGGPSCPVQAAPG